MPKRVAFFPTSSPNPYQTYLEASARAVAARRDIELDVKGPAEGEAQSAIQHIARVFETLRQKPGHLPDAILVQPTSPQCAAVVEAAARVRVACAVLNRRPDFLPEMRRRFPGIPLFSAGPDQRAMGRLQGEQFRALLPEGGRLLYVQGNEMESAVQDRRAGMLEAISGSPIEVLPLYGDWSDEKAEQVVLEWLNKLRVDEPLPGACGCQNDSMAEGARRALDRFAAARGLRASDCRVTGCDGVPEHGQRMVQEGTLAATVVRGSASAAALEALAAYFARGVTPEAYLDMPVRSFPPVEALAAGRGTSGPDADAPSLPAWPAGGNPGDPPSRTY